MKKKNLQKLDPAVYVLIKQETARQQDKISLIPSENFFSLSVREAVGSVFMHKYGEGNIGKRYYEGCENIDQLEALTIDRAKKAFRVPHNWQANVQALSGSNANLAVYLALLQPGDTILAMYLPDGGHLSHGWSYEPNKPSPSTDLVYEGGSRKVHIVSRMFKVIQYKTNPKTQLLDYTQLKATAKKYKPKLIITGGTSYPRLIDHKKIKTIAQSVGAIYMADIAHEAGLVVAGVIPSPVGIADIVTMTTHKTLRSGRGAIILASQDIIQKVDRAVLPGLQGGPHFHNMAGICVGLGEALKPNFKTYAKQILKNTDALAKALQKYDFQLVSGGADKHLVLINLENKPLLGKKFARALSYAGLVTNFNTIPQETRSPSDPSGLRLGTPWVTTRGMKTKEMLKIARWIHDVMQLATPWAEVSFEQFEKEVKHSKDILKISREVKALCRIFPLK